MNHNSAQRSPGSEPGNPVDFGQSMSMPQSADGWHNSYGMDFFDANVSFSGAYMTPMDAGVPMFSDLTPTSTKAEFQLDTPVRETQHT